MCLVLDAPPPIFQGGVRPLNFTQATAAIYSNMFYSKTFKKRLYYLFIIKFEIVFFNIIELNLSRCTQVN